jgi:Cu(I)/Ag(I) efflux system membrane fusion protein
MKKVVFLISMLALPVTGNVYAHTNHNQVDSVEAQQPEAKVISAGLPVQGSCGMCKTRIEKTAKGTDGVSFASWDAKTKELQLRFDAGKTSPDAVAKALAKAGHDTEKYKADDKTYNALPGCCKYRKE